MPVADGLAEVIDGDEFWKAVVRRNNDVSKLQHAPPDSMMCKVDVTSISAVHVFAMCD